MAAIGGEETHTGEKAALDKDEHENASSSSPISNNTARRGRFHRVRSLFG